MAAGTFFRAVRLILGCGAIDVLARLSLTGCAFGGSLAAVSTRGDTP
jgi:hypothetical protein